jgi:uncharacterized repeat protein (TIGR03943 family)
MVAAVNREVQSVLLVLLGGAVLRISLGDTYLRYVKEGLQPFLLAAGGILLLLGLASAWYDGLARPLPGPASTAADDDGHGHDTLHGPRVAWMLLLPVLAIFLVAPPALGSYAAARDAGTVAQPADGSFPALPAGDVVDLGVVDFATRAVWDVGRSLEGRTVALTGFVTPDGAGGWYLTRISLSCCAADGRATKVAVRGAPAPPADRWVRLTGEWVPDGPAMTDDAVPAITARDVVEVDAPRNPYE